MRTPYTSKYWKAGQRAMANYLADQNLPVLFFTLSSVADSAARAARKKNDLFESLYDYVELLPSNWTTTWIGRGGTSDSLYYAVPRGWKAGPVQPSLSRLLIGSAGLHEVAAPDL
jgi:hypothetical protein